jgi:hypothetical protein
MASTISELARADLPAIQRSIRVLPPRSRSRLIGLSHYQVTRGSGTGRSPVPDSPPSSSLPLSGLLGYPPYMVTSMLCRAPLMRR